MTLDDTIDANTATSLLYSGPLWGNVRQLWSHALRHKFPVRTNAALQGVELPECDVDTWQKAFGSKTCFLCGGNYLDFRGLAVHHIDRRSQVSKVRRDWIENLMLVCGSCHATRIHGYRENIDWSQSMTHAEQLAHKWRHDHCGWATLDEFLERWLQVRDVDLKAPERVTVAEVEHYLARAA